MGLDTQEAIYEEFRAAVREHLMGHLKQDGDWKRLHEIQNETKDRIEHEMQDWNESYHSRMAEARQIILREIHGNVLEPPKPDGVSSIPDRQKLDFLADQRIRRDHHQRIAVIKQDELDRYQDLNRVIQYRGHVKGQAKEAFDKVCDQHNQTRSGPSR